MGVKELIELKKALYQLISASEAALHYIETPGDFAEHEVRYLIEDLSRTIRNAESV